MQSHQYTPYSHIHYDYQVTPVTLSPLADGIDYIGGSRNVTFVSSGPTQQSALYTVLGDDIPELTENFIVLVSSTAHGVVLAPSNATAVIVDDDGESLY